MTTKRVKAAEALVDILEREGVSVIFGIPGGPLLPLYDQLANHPKIRLILVKHEQAAAYAAFAYARVTGQLGVCVATLGPGATNLLAGLPVALIASVPILALTGQVQTTAYARSAHQESTGWFRTPNQEAMYAATCKHTATCNEASRFPDFVRHSIRIATSGRPGPAHLIIPANLLHQTIDYTPLNPSEYRLLESHICDDAAIESMAREIAKAHYPLIMLGERALLDAAGREVQLLGERFSIPVVTDLSCKSAIDEWSPVFMGCMGVLGHRAGEKYLKEKCDLVLAVGQTFNEISTLSWDPSFVTGRRLIQLDTDPEEIGKVYPVAAASVGHLPTMLTRLVKALDTLGVSIPGERKATVAGLRKQYPLFSANEMHSEKVPLLPQRVVNEVRQGLPEDALILSDSSKWTRWLGRYFPARQGTFVTAHDYEPMGWAVAGVIGAKLACPDRPVVCVSGDGAFLMSAMELSTAANYKLDILWLIMNDSRLGIIYDLQKMLYGGRIASTTFENPDFVQFAASFGITGQVIEKPGELAAGLRTAIQRGGAAVFDVHFDPDEIPTVRPRSLLITKEMGLPNPKPGPEVTRAFISLLKEK
ncbi:MAG: thiamine pyrophosphate-binding protein [Chloroflexi bacterium]|nr:thiamine pyrophosphate-binding protein [Chloroflexota bacterium]